MNMTTVNYVMTDFTRTCMCLIQNVQHWCTLPVLYYSTNCVLWGHHLKLVLSKLHINTDVNYQPSYLKCMHAKWIYN